MRIGKALYSEPKLMVLILAIALMALAFVVPLKRHAEAILFDGGAMLVIACLMLIVVEAHSST